jgi:hypothetical protein
LNTGFELVETVSYTVDTFGPIITVEFFELYLTYVFSIFFESSVMYEVLANGNEEIVS